MDSNTMNGMYVRPRQFPNLYWPRYKGWFKTKANLSPEASKATMFQCASGMNLTQINFARRRWHQQTPQTRDEDNDLDLTTPAYMLAGSDLTSDSVVGLDYHNPPIKYAQWLSARKAVSQSNVNGTDYMRVLAISHNFTVSNFSRFPLEIYYSVFPGKWEPQNNAHAADCMLDPAVSGYRKKVIPPVRDDGDRSKKRTIQVDMNLQKLFPLSYQALPQAINGDTTTTSTDSTTSPWIFVNNWTTSSMYRNVPPGQAAKHNVDPTTGVPHGIHEDMLPCLHLRMYARLQMPINVGSTDTTNIANGELDTNGFMIEGDFNWLIEHLDPQRRAQEHPGELAYPNQSA